MKFCKDCKHQRGKAGIMRADEYLCEAPPAEVHRNSVTGEYPRCSIQRLDFKDTCGPNAAWFEPKDSDE